MPPAAPPPTRPGRTRSRGRTRRAHRRRRRAVRRGGPRPRARSPRASVRDGPRPAGWHGRIASVNLVLRAWEDDDAVALGRAIAESLEHLRPWMPWVAFEPQSDVGAARMDPRGPAPARRGR